MAKLAESFGQEVRARRKARGLTQAQLAEATSMSEEWIRKIERGAGSPSFDAIEALANALDAAPGDFFRSVEAADVRMLRVAGLFAGLPEAEQAWLEKLVQAAAARP